jgi:small subunit ribosomal protein S17
MVKTLTGKIVSLKMQKTAVVEIVNKAPHPLYKKIIKRNRNIKADTNGMELILGQNVKIAETKPISKEKFFKVVEVIK